AGRERQPRPLGAGAGAARARALSPRVREPARLLSPCAFGAGHSTRAQPDLAASGRASSASGGLRPRRHRARRARAAALRGDGHAHRLRREPLVAGVDGALDLDAAADLRGGGLRHEPADDPVGEHPWRVLVGDRALRRGRRRVVGAAEAVWYPLDAIPFATTASDVLCFYRAARGGLTARFRTEGHIVMKRISPAALAAALFFVVPASAAPTLSGKYIVTVTKFCQMANTYQFGSAQNVGNFVAGIETSGSNFKQ